MNAWLWTANPLEKWTGVPGKPNLTPFDALDQYLGLNGGIRYVYRATPVFRAQIRIGDAGYVWLSSGGLIAAGVVAEKPPQKYEAGHNKDKFNYPAQLSAPGWSPSRHGSAASAAAALAASIRLFTVARCRSKPF
jgi:hypothetical protein